MKKHNAFYTGHLNILGIKFTQQSRAWYNGSTSASQAEDEGSIPFARTTLRLGEAEYNNIFICFMFILYNLKNFQIKDMLAIPQI